ncbi:hypothetical protein AB1N83_010009 [Pleurotus pulmonarius]|nr:hypothetical protein EYR36_009018 [Pleurotus pulmonarius]
MSNEYDVWQHISGYLSTSELRGLMSVNYALYDMAMDAIYREVSWHHLDADMVKSLTCLSDPRVAKRVHKLDIRLWFLRFQFDECLRICSSVKAWKTDVRRKPTTVETQLAALLKGGPDVTVDAMQCALEKLRELYECVLDIRWSPLPVGRVLRSLFHTLSQNNLRKLDLRFHDFDVVDELIRIPLKSLRELSLEFTCSPELRHEVSVVRLTQFANRVGPHLTMFSLSTPPQFDYSAFFANLGEFSRLHKLVLRVALSHQISSESPLLSFLRAVSPHLTTFEFHPRFSYLSDPLFFTSLRHTEDVLSDLQVLTLSNVSDFDLTLSLLRRSQGTISELTVKSHLLEFSQVKALVLAATDCSHNALRALHVEVQVLSPAVLDFIARCLPCLENLHILYKTVCGGHLDPNDHETYTSADGAVSIDGFTQPMLSSPPRYQDWGLRTIRVWEGDVHDEITTADEEKIIHSLAWAIPGLMLTQ